MEWKLFQGDQPPEQSTFEFHEHRERAPHIDQEWHRGRLDTALEYVRRAVTEHDCDDIVDLGCGDGGLLALIKDNIPEVNPTKTWGYEFTPANVAGAVERGVTVIPMDFARNLNSVYWADVLVMTETLEHVHDPHDILRYAHSQGVKVLVASSPWNENDLDHDGCHVWAWDMEGYAALVTQAGFTVRSHVKTGLFQVIMATA